MKSAITEKFYFDKFVQNRESLKPFDKTQKEGIPSQLILDIIVGIASNEPAAIGPVMCLLGISKEKHSVIKALIHLYNKNNSMLAIAAEDVEKYIENN